MKRASSLRARSGRLLAVAAALAGASLSLTACDASPYAADVNGQSISQVTLNHQLSEWSSNKTWVSSFNSANSSSNGGSGATVAGSGGSGTYSSAFVAEILENVVQTTIIHQRLSQTGEQPTADEVTASRAVNEYLRSQYWDQFSASLRQFLVTQLAEQAVLTPISTDTSTLQSAYNTVKPFLASRVCVRQASAFSDAAAEQIAGSGKVGGAVSCYAQDQLEAQSAAFQSAVEKLSAGQVAPPVKTSFGWIVVQLVSRQAPGLTPGVERVLSVVTGSNEPQQITNLVNRAKVKINPTYGTWSQGKITPPSLTGS